MVNIYSKWVKDSLSNNKLYLNPTQMEETMIKCFYCLSMVHDMQIILYKNVFFLSYNFLHVMYRGLVDIVRSHKL